MRYRLLPTLLLVAGCTNGIVPTPTPENPAKEVIGALFDRTGSASQSGANIEAGLVLAEADINAYAARKGSSFRVKLQAENAAGDPVAA